MSADDPKLNDPLVPPPASRTPLFNAPLVVVLLSAVMVLVHMARSGVFGGQGAAEFLALWLGVIRTGTFATEIPPAPLFGLTPYVLHVFVHFGWLHLIVNVGVFLAVGSATARAFGTSVKATLGFLAFFVTCAIGGAVLAWLVSLNTSSLIAGASTSISGLIAAAGWVRGGRAGMLQLAMPWLVFNLALAVIELFIDQPISWSGHIGGLLVGMVSFPVFLAVFRDGPTRQRPHRPF